MSKPLTIDELKALEVGDWVDAGISYEEAQRINQECCKSHRQLSAEETGAMK